jgi:acetoacetyl-CoA synthetase
VSREIVSLSQQNGIAVPAIPMTLTGKNMEVSVRRIRLGVTPQKAANASAMADPRALDFFIEYAATQRDYGLGED